MRTEKWLLWEPVSVSQRISHKENQSSKFQDFSEIKPHLSSWWIQLSGGGTLNVNKVGSVVIGFEKKMPLILQFCTKKCKYMEYWKSNKVFKSSNILHKCQYSHYWEYNLSDFFTLLLFFALKLNHVYNSEKSMIKQNSEPLVAQLSKIPWEKSSDHPIPLVSGLLPQQSKVLRWK